MLNVFGSLCLIVASAISIGLIYKNSKRSDKLVRPASLANANDEPAELIYNDSSKPLVLFYIAFGLIGIPFLALQLVPDSPNNVSVGNNGYIICGILMGIPLLLFCFNMLFQNGDILRKRKIVLTANHICLYGYSSDPQIYKISQFDGYCSRTAKGEIVKVGCQYEIYKSYSREGIVLKSRQLMPSRSKEWQKIEEWLDSHYERIFTVA